MTDSEKALRVDANYRNTADWKQPSDQFNKFFRFEDGKGIATGFRPKSKLGGSTDILNCAFCIVVTNLEEVEWPDSLDPESGLFTYYGDNRKPAVGVKPMMRLISRLKHRDVGVFVTTSFFGRQVQSELIEDQHPVLLISGGDIAKLIISRELGGNVALPQWIESVRVRAAQQR